jgi:hypothetical protein
MLLGHVTVFANALNKKQRLCSASRSTSPPLHVRQSERSRSANLLPSCIVRRLIQYMPHNTHLYLYRPDRDPVCCQPALYGACSQCDAVRAHAAQLWPCLRAIRSPAHEHDASGCSVSALLVNHILDLHLHMQQDDDYEPVYSGRSIARAHQARAAWEQQIMM